MSYQDIIDLVNGSHRSKKRRSVLRGLLVGSAIGVGTGLLFAPRPGSATRQRFVDGAVNTGLAVQVGSMRTANRLKTTVDSLTTNVKAVATDVGTTVQAVQDSMKHIKALKLTLERSAGRLAKQEVDIGESGERLVAASEEFRSEAEDLKSKMT